MHVGDIARNVRIKALPSFKKMYLKLKLDRKNLEAMLVSGAKWNLRQEL